MRNARPDRAESEETMMKKMMKMTKTELVKIARLENGLTNVSDKMTKAEIVQAILDHQQEQERTKAEILQKADERNNEQTRKQEAIAEHISKDSVIEVNAPTQDAPTEPTKDEPTASTHNNLLTLDVEKRKATFPYSILKDGEIKQAVQSITIPKNVKNGAFTPYSIIVAITFIGAKISSADVKRMTVSRMIEEQEEAQEHDVEELNKAKAEREKLNQLITVLTKEQNRFTQPMQECRQAEGHGLVLAHGEIPVQDANRLLAIYIDTCKALNRFTKDGVKTGTATFSKDEVEAINRFRSVFKTAYGPYTNGDALTHRLKYGLNEADLVEVLLPQYLTYNFNTGKTKVRFTKKRVAGFTALGMKLILGKANAKIEK